MAVELPFAGLLARLRQPKVQRIALAAALVLVATVAATRALLDPVRDERTTGLSQFWRLLANPLAIILLLAAGVDIIGADHLAQFRDYLVQRAAGRP